MAASRLITSNMPTSAKQRGTSRKRPTSTQPAKATTIKPLFAKWGVWACLGLIVLVTAILRIRLLGVPLERDEGEFAYGGQLILDGVAPYRDLYAMKLPGIYGAYAAIMAVFGQSITGIHLG